MDAIKLLNSAEIMDRMNLNWKVAQAPVLFEGNGLKQYEGRKVNFRTDTGAALGIVSDRYQIVQNSTAFAFLDSFLGEQIEMYTKAGSWKGGAQIYIRAKLPGGLVFAGNEEDRGEKFVDFNTSHDGSIALEASITALRLVCTNGLKAFTKIAGGRVKHTTNLNLGTLRESLGLMNEQFRIMEMLSEKMAAQPFHRENMAGVLEKVGAIPAEQKRSSRAQNILEEVSRLFDGWGKGANMAGARGTAWGAYNAITEYVDHRRLSNAEAREESATIGTGARMKENALEVLSA